METSLVTNDILYVCQKSLQCNNVYTGQIRESYNKIFTNKYNSGVEIASFLLPECHSLVGATLPCSRCAGSKVQGGGRTVPSIPTPHKNLGRKPVPNQSAQNIIKPFDVLK